MLKPLLKFFLYGTGMLCTLLGVMSDVVRGRPLLIGPIQIIFMVIGVFIFTLGIIVHLSEKAGWFKQEWVPDSIFILIVLFSCAFIGYVKIDTFNSWRYTIDLFAFDTAIKETARGNWGLEFTYGNTFGDHAYFFLLALVPLALICKASTIYALLLSGPLVFAITSIIFYYTVRQFTDIKKTFLLSLIFLLGFGLTFISLIETQYGMHPDTYAGYLAVAMTSFLLYREKRESQGQTTTLQNLGAFIFLFLFVIQKEEMSLLAVIFFLIVFIFRRTKFHLYLLIFSVLALGAGIFVMEISQTPFNRTNLSVIDNFIISINEHGLISLFNAPNNGQAHRTMYWVTVIISCISFLVTLLVFKTRNIYTLSLFIVGLVLMGFSISVLDFNVTKWHTFPGIVMMMAAVLFQIAMSTKQVKFTQLLILSFLVFSVIMFWVSNLPFLADRLRSNYERKPIVKQATIEFNEMQHLIDPMKIVALPNGTKAAWLDFRNSSYPRGVFRSPIGIADYVVIKKDSKDVLLLTSFEEIHQTQTFLLFKRIIVSEEDEKNREYFRKFGID